MLVYSFGHGFPDVFGNSFNFRCGCDRKFFSNVFCYVLFSKTVLRTIRAKFSTPQYGPMCAISINSYDSGIGASQKEKDLSRLLYRICGSGLKNCVFETIPAGVSDVCVLHETFRFSKVSLILIFLPKSF